MAIGLLGFSLVYVKTAASKAGFFIREAGVYAYSRLNFIGFFASKIESQKNLIEENMRLKEENYNLLSRLAVQSDIEDQNVFLRQVLNLPVSVKLGFLEAGIFNFQFTPKGYYFSLNKGSRHGVDKGDIVITSSGILLGAAEEIFETYSVVSSVVNSEFKTTIHVLSKNISGIAKGAVGGGLELDFISQNDEVIEGDVIVTSGMDTLPPGLAVGKVVEVSSSGGDVFKKIKVEPFFKDISLGRVLIIKSKNI